MSNEENERVLRRLRERLQPDAKTPPPTPDPFHRISAVRNVGWWIVDVYATNKRGHGQAKNWLDAVNAAIEDLKEKKS